MGTLQQESFIPEKPTKQHPHSASSTHSPALSTPAASHPHHTACRNSKARAPRNAVPAHAHRLNRADTIEQRSPQPHTKTGRTHPARGPPPAASTRGRHPPPHLRNHTDTPHHCH
ncbi:hypothetical protein AMECASPLE_038406 [Ameca splendens]|uniref:Uncharacterized protein n=1 Tax=Ameca splendens TaxID=208324 RepID=A0ABV0Z7B5_9TELE